MQDASKYAVDEAVAQKRADSEDLDAQLAGYYFGTQLALSVEKLQKDMLHHQDRELAKAKKFEKQGMISANTSKPKTTLKSPASSLRACCATKSSEN